MPRYFVIVNQYSVFTSTAKNLCGIGPIRSNPFFFIWSVCWWGLKFIDFNGVPRRFIGVSGSWLLHPSNEPHLIRLIALNVDARHFNPHQNLGLHSFYSGELPPRKRGFHTAAVSYNRWVLETELAGIRQMHYELTFDVVVFVAYNVLGEESRWKVVFSKQIRQRFCWFSWDVNEKTAEYMSWHIWKFCKKIWTHPGLPFSLLNTHFAFSSTVLVKLWNHHHFQSNSWITIWHETKKIATKTSLYIYIERDLHTERSWEMLEISCLAFLETQKVPALMLPTLVRAFSIALYWKISNARQNWNLRDTYSNLFFYFLFPPAFPLALSFSLSQNFCHLVSILSNTTTSGSK